MRVAQAEAMYMLPIYLVRVAERRCVMCGREFTEEGCTPTDCSLLGARMEARLKARE